MTDSDTIRRAMVAAGERGMQYRPIPGNPDHAEIWCGHCDWPLLHRETVIAQYARAPYGCAHCGAPE